MKPLHERLRDISDSYSGLTFEVLFEDESKTISEIFEELANEIECDYTLNGNLDEIFADWIERMAQGEVKFPRIFEAVNKYCIWRPCFKDGEPVRFGDRAANKYFEMESPVDCFSFSADGVVEILGNGNSLVFEEDERVERPTPKIFDADGVEIKVGDKVWNLDSAPDYKFGIVKEIVPAVVAKDKVLVVCENDNGVWAFNKYPEKLTHRDPDSLEKLRDDIVSRVTDKRCPVYQDYMLRNYADRLTALIERGAK